MSSHIPHSEDTHSIDHDFDFVNVSHIAKHGDQLMSPDKDFSRQASTRSADNELPIPFIKTPVKSVRLEPYTPIGPLRLTTTALGVAPSPIPSPLAQSKQLPLAPSHDLVARMANVVKRQELWAKLIRKERQKVIIRRRQRRDERETWAAQYTTACREKEELEHRVAAILAKVELKERERSQAASEATSSSSPLSHPLLGAAACPPGLLTDSHTPTLVTLADMPSSSSSSPAPATDVTIQPYACEKPLVSSAKMLAIGASLSNDSSLRSDITQCMDATVDWSLHTSTLTASTTHTPFSANSSSLASSVLSPTPPPALYTVMGSFLSTVAQPRNLPLLLLKHSLLKAHSRAALASTAHYAAKRKYDALISRYTASLEQLKELLDAVKRKEKALVREEEEERDRRREMEETMLAWEREREALLLAVATAEEKLRLYQQQEQQHLQDNVGEGDGNMLVCVHDVNATVANSACPVAQISQVGLHTESCNDHNDNMATAVDKSDKYVDMSDKEEEFHDIIGNDEDILAIKATPKENDVGNRTERAYSDGNLNFSRNSPGFSKSSGKMAPRRDAAGNEDSFELGVGRVPQWRTQLEHAQARIQALEDQLAAARSEFEYNPERMRNPDGFFPIPNVDLELALEESEERAKKAELKVKRLTQRVRELTFTLEAAQGGMCAQECVDVYGHTHVHTGAGTRRNMGMGEASAHTYAQDYVPTAADYHHLAAQLAEERENARLREQLLISEREGWRVREQALLSGAERWREACYEAVAEMQARERREQSTDVGIGGWKDAYVVEERGCGEEWTARKYTSKSTISSPNSDAETVRSQLEHTKADLHASKAALAASHAELLSLRENEVANQTKIVALKQEVATLQHHKDTMRQEMTMQERELDVCRAELGDVRRELEISQRSKHSHRFSLSKEQKIDSQELGSLQRENQALSTDMESLQREKYLLIQEKDTFSRDKEELCKELEFLRSENAMMHQKQKKLMSQRTRMRESAKSVARRGSVDVTDMDITHIHYSHSPTATTAATITATAPASTSASVSGYVDMYSNEDAGDVSYADEDVNVTGSTTHPLDNTIDAVINTYTPAPASVDLDDSFLSFSATDTMSQSAPHFAAVPLSAAPAAEPTPATSMDAGQASACGEQADSLHLHLLTASLPHAPHAPHAPYSSPIGATSARDASVQNVAALRCAELEEQLRVTMNALAAASSAAATHSSRAGALEVLVAEERRKCEELRERFHNALAVVGRMEREHQEERKAREHEIARCMRERDEHRALWEKNREEREEERRVIQEYREQCSGMLVTAENEKRQLLEYIATLQAHIVAMQERIATHCSAHDSGRAHTNTATDTNSSDSTYTRNMTTRANIDASGNEVGVHLSVHVANDGSISLVFIYPKGTAVDHDCVATSANTTDTTTSTTATMYGTGAATSSAEVTPTDASLCSTTSTPTINTSTPMPTPSSCAACAERYERLRKALRRAREAEMRVDAAVGVVMELEKEKRELAELVARMEREKEVNGAEDVVKIMQIGEDVEEQDRELVEMTAELQIEREDVEIGEEEAKGAEVMLALPGMVGVAGEKEVVAVVEEKREQDETRKAVVEMKANVKVECYSVECYGVLSAEEKEDYEGQAGAELEMPTEVKVEEGNVDEADGGERGEDAHEGMHGCNHGAVEADAETETGVEVEVEVDVAASVGVDGVEVDGSVWAEAGVKGGISHEYEHAWSSTEEEVIDDAMVWEEGAEVEVEDTKVEGAEKPSTALEEVDADEWLPWGKIGQDGDGTVAMDMVVSGNTVEVGIETVGLSVDAVAHVVLDGDGNAKADVVAGGALWGGTGGDGSENNECEAEQQQQGPEADEDMERGEPEVGGMMQEQTSAEEGRKGNEAGTRERDVEKCEDDWGWSDTDNDAFVSANTDNTTIVIAAATDNICVVATKDADSDILRDIATTTNTCATDTNAYATANTASALAGDTNDTAPAWEGGVADIFAAHTPTFDIHLRNIAVHNSITDLLTVSMLEHEAQEDREMDDGGEAVGDGEMKSCEQSIAHVAHTQVDEDAIMGAPVPTNEASHATYLFLVSTTQNDDLMLETEEGFDEFGAFAPAKDVMHAEMVFTRASAMDASAVSNSTCVFEDFESAAGTQGDVLLAYDPVASLTLSPTHASISAAMSLPTVGADAMGVRADEGLGVGVKAGRGVQPVELHAIVFDDCDINAAFDSDLDADVDVAVDGHVIDPPNDSANTPPVEGVVLYTHVNTHAPDTYTPLQSEFPPACVVDDISPRGHQNTVCAAMEVLSAPHAASADAALTWTPHAPTVAEAVAITADPNIVPITAIVDDIASADISASTSACDPIPLDDGADTSASANGDGGSDGTWGTKWGVSPKEAYIVAVTAAQNQAVAAGIEWGSQPTCVQDEHEEGNDSINGEEPKEHEEVKGEQIKEEGEGRGGEGEKGDSAVTEDTPPWDDDDFSFDTAFIGADTQDFAENDAFSEVSIPTEHNSEPALNANSLCTTTVAADIEDMGMYADNAVKPTKQPVDGFDTGVACGEDDTDVVIDGATIDLSGNFDISLGNLDFPDMTMKTTRRTTSVTTSAMVCKENVVTAEDWENWGEDDDF